MADDADAVAAAEAAPPPPHPEPDDDPIVNVDAAPVPEVPHISDLSGDIDVHI